jgi:5,5'-dehydrodivanillate O-demethylase
MLTVEQNQKLTQVGPGTPGGALMRRYWHPIAAVGELDARPTKAVRLLGEDLVLYKDNSGTYGLLDRYCPHRRVDLSYGIPEEHGLRCMYHGWMFDETGACTEQPFEETVHPDGRFKEKTGIAGYPVQALGGLLFAYMGPQPAPLLPRWDILVETENVLREVFLTELPVNWLQCQENSVDPVHLEWLHGVYGAYAARLRGYRDAVAESLAGFERHKEIGFDRFERGIIKRRAYGNTSKDSPKWAVGHPLLFPNILQQGGGGRFFLQFRVPVDDDHTLHIELTSYWLPTDVQAPTQDDHDVPWQYLTLRHPDGELRADDTISQDHIVWILQGSVMDRSAEKLGESDRGLILFRQMLDEQIDAVADGKEPLNTFRDAAKNQKLHNEQEGWGRLGTNSDMDEVCRYGSQLRGVIGGLLSKTAVAASQKNTA